MSTKTIMFTLILLISLSGNFAKRIESCTEAHKYLPNHVCAFEPVELNFIQNGDDCNIFSMITKGDKSKTVYAVKTWSKDETKEVKDQAKNESKMVKTC